MSDETRCSFCETLPTTAPGSWGGRASKCPLCRQELWTGSDGSTYRLSDAPAPARSKRGWAIGTGVLVAVGLIVGCYVAFKPREVENPTGTVAPIQARSEPIAKADGPIVQAKWAWPAYDAQAKPLPARVVNGTPTKPTVVAQAATKQIDKPTPVSKGSGVMARATSRGWSGTMATSEALQAELGDLPQVDLDPEYLKKKKDQIAGLAKEIVDATRKDKDAFIHKLVKDRQDIAGLPFLLGDECKLVPSQASNLAGQSRLIRDALSGIEKVSSSKSPKSREVEMEKAAARFWTSLDRYPSMRDGAKPERIPALQQILQVENKHLRYSLVERLSDHTKATSATDLLVNRALFDIEPEVRLAALEALRRRPRVEFRPALEKALRYPWRPVVHHAAQIILTLDMQEMVPYLVAMLDEPDPNAPIVMKGMDGQAKNVVRELVRINHHRNCMLCHAPLDQGNKEEMRLARNLPIGPTPNPEETLPPASSTVYYETRPGVTVVRADITYLRQDFSLMQSVKDHGKWPEMQRFDFIVRNRELTPKEPRFAPPAVEYRAIILEALIGLTGTSAEPTARAWRDALAALQTPNTAKAKPAR